MALRVKSRMHIKRDYFTRSRFAEHIHINIYIYCRYVHVCYLPAQISFSCFIDISTSFLPFKQLYLQVKNNYFSLPISTFQFSSVSYFEFLFQSTFLFSLFSFDIKITITFDCIKKTYSKYLNIFNITKSFF